MALTGATRHSVAKALLPGNRTPPRWLSRTDGQAQRTATEVSEHEVGTSNAEASTKLLTFPLRWGARGRIGRNFIEAAYTGRVRRFQRCFNQQGVETM